MNRRYNNKTTPKVVDGKVQKKYNHAITAREGYTVDRKRPYKGFKHVITKKEIHDFIELIPDWEKLGIGIEAIILDEGGDNFDGLYCHYEYEKTGIIWLSAWPKEMWVDFNDEYFKEHQWHFDTIGLVYEKNKDEWTCHFTEKQAKAFMLTHIFLHELGHHVDKLRSKKQNIMVGGEEYAEKFANDKFNEIWPSYVQRFGQP